jgi:CSLREA domain-containing protein
MSSLAYHRTAIIAAVLALLATTLVLIAGPVSPAGAATTFTVNTTADTTDADTGNGVCADAGGMCSLRAAVMQANATAGADTIVLPAGTYTLALAGAEDAAAAGDLDITDDLTINGVGAPTTIVDAGGLDRVFQILGTTAASIAGITITGGSTGVGGGIHAVIAGSTLTLTNSTVSGNTATVAGGIYVASVTANLTGVTLSGNTGALGGAMRSFSTALTIDNSTIGPNNTSPTTGGGMTIDGGTATIRNGSVITGNDAVADGGGIHVAAGTVTIAGTEISANTADSNTDSVGDGGAVYAGGGTVTIDDSLIDGGNSAYDGGGVHVELGTVNINDTTVAENDATHWGGGIHTSGGTLAVNRSTLARNAAETTAGLHVAGGTSTVTNSTISSNTAAVNVGGVGVSGGTLSLVSSSVVFNTAVGIVGGIAVSGGPGALKATIVAENAATTSPDCLGVPTSNGYNLIGNDSGCTYPAGGTGDQVGTGASPIDPLLGPLQDNGSPDTHALLQGSPAINAIPNAACGVSEDERQVSRPQGGACDIGAFEATPATAVNDSYVVGTGTLTVNAADGVLSNDTDVEGDTLTVDNPGAASAVNGTLALAADGSFSYTPDSGFSGNDTFTYRAADGTGLSNVATVTIAAASADTVGLVDPGTGKWYLRNGAGAVTSFFYGNPGDVPFMGDWDGDGVATPGLFRQSDAFAYLRDSNTQGIADIRFFFGNPSDIPLSGDWDGDGKDTLSIYRPSEQRFYIINKLGENEGGLGAADYSFLFGNPGDKPVVGDWDGDGIDEVGLHRESTGFFYWRDTLDTGVADGEIFFGDPGDRFVAGDWGTVDGKDTPGLFRPSDVTFYFRHTLTQGVADSQFTWTGAGTSWLPVAGQFGLG